MISRRRFLQSASLLATSPVIPRFVEQTALAAPAGKETILVVLELTGGNDGLNTVIPFKDPNYSKLRPRIALPASSVIGLNTDVGLNPAMPGLGRLAQDGMLSVVQGVGYPNPDRSHFESMDRWQSGKITLPVEQSGWIARSTPGLSNAGGGSIPVLHVGAEKLPLACRGTLQGVFSISQEQPVELRLANTDELALKQRRKLLSDVADSSATDDPMMQFVQRRQLQTYSAVETLKEVLKGQDFSSNRFGGANVLAAKFGLIATLIERGFGTRVFYAAIDGFDTHGNQLATHPNLLTQVDQAISGLFQRLKLTGDDKRTLVLTYSEFGRRADENGSQGTDHGSGSCMFVVGHGAKGGVVGKHPSLTDLDQGDLRFHTDFRRVYAEVLDRWLKVDSQLVLGDKFEPVDCIKK